MTSVHEANAVKDQLKSWSERKGYPIAWGLGKDGDDFVVEARLQGISEAEAGIPREINGVKIRVRDLGGPISPQ